MAAGGRPLASNPDLIADSFVWSDWVIALLALWTLTGHWPSPSLRLIIHLGEECSLFFPRLRMSRNVEINVQQFSVSGSRISDARAIRPSSQIPMGFALWVDA
jgi:hypothetical protein